MKSLKENLHWISQQKLCGKIKQDIFLLFKFSDFFGLWTSSSDANNLLSLAQLAFGILTVKVILVVQALFANQSGGWHYIIKDPSHLVLVLLLLHKWSDLYLNSMQTKSEKETLITNALNAAFVSQVTACTALKNVSNLLQRTLTSKLPCQTVISASLPGEHSLWFFQMQDVSEQLQLLEVFINSLVLWLLDLWPAFQLILSSDNQDGLRSVLHFQEPLLA